MKRLFILLLLCRIFSFEGEGQNSTQEAVSDWLKDKEVISVTQSSSSWGMTRTTITIIAEAK